MDLAITCCFSCFFLGGGELYEENQIYTKKMKTEIHGSVSGQKPTYAITVKSYGNVHED